jgi:rhodanese-related sulfurtransferase
VTDSPSATLSAKELHELLGGSAEFALIDVREPRITAEQGSILLAVSLPLSGLELRAGFLIPRLSTPVIVYDGGNGDLAGRGAARLRELGYTDVRTLDGGIRAWSEAGYKVHTGGDRVIGQAFGEWIEEIYGTPHISVPDYLAKVAGGEDLVLLDSRPLSEFQNHSLPNGTSIPGAELVYRARELVTSPDSLVVVHCAGRTRSILGAQVLINAGLPNRVVALEGGTQSWVLEGHELDHGKSSAAPLPSPGSLAAAKASTEHIAERFGVPSIDKSTLAAFQAERDQRTLYVLDVRTPEEFETGHLAGSVSAPSWDVAPWVFRYVGTHNARIVLVDNDLVRATTAASWLVQFGWGEVFVLADALAGETLETGPVPVPVLGLPGSGYDLVTAEQLRQEIDAQADVQVVDLQPSGSYASGHIPGAIWASRASLPSLAGEIPGAGLIVVSSEDGIAARFAAAELSAVTSRPVSVLDGGSAAWRQAGYGLPGEEATFLHEPYDAVASGWRETEPEAQKAGFRRYLSWELGLVAELNEDDTVPFKTFA